ncbi:hypothetical protein GGG16DRAFT_84367, partial [Schizophyllum commune]
MTSSYPIQKSPLLLYPTRTTMSKPCNTCGQLFTSTYALEEHILKAPNHPKCATCKKSFRDEKGLEQHIQKEHQALFCRVCAARFPSGQALADHIARDHPSATRRTGSTPPGYFELIFPRIRPLLVRSLHFFDDASRFIPPSG